MNQRALTRSATAARPPTAMNQQHQRCADELFSSVMRKLAFIYSLSLAELIIPLACLVHYSLSVVDVMIMYFFVLVNILGTLLGLCVGVFNMLACKFTTVYLAVNWDNVLRLPREL